MRSFLVVLLALACAVQALAQTPLKYVPAPADNPLKGLVPYARPHADPFPHSMEFNYVPLSDLMTGPNEFNWERLEKLLDDIASRRHQSVFRIWMEYPGREDGIPKFLQDAGVKVTEWLNTDNAPSRPMKLRTPDYNDPKLRAALQSFIAALGKKYDGDPRIGFITAGLLGMWGEWHTHPRSELMASKEVQAEVMDAYERAFQTTPVLLRYPAGENDRKHAANHHRRLGYHDDSFAWATLDTGLTIDKWFYIPLLKASGQQAMVKWKTSPIGGEIRPEIWGQIFDDHPEHEHAQDFAKCVLETHATWLMDSGMFREQASESRKNNAIKQVQRMGYEFHIESAERNSLPNGGMAITIRIRNTGIAPFYYPWKIELATSQKNGKSDVIPVDWLLTGLLPDDPARVWTCELTPKQANEAANGIYLRVVNPLPNGLALRFANEYPDPSQDDWWPLPSPSSN